MANDTTREVRNMAVAELRADDTDGKVKLRGYAAVFNRWSEDLGWFREQIAPGAFADVLRDDVRALFNHDSNYVLGRTKAGTLRMSEDDRGLLVEIDAPVDGPLVGMVVNPIRRGDINQMSFAFSMDGGAEKWDYSKDVPERTLEKIGRLYDVSPVTYPAYPDTSIAARSLDAARKLAVPSGYNVAIRRKALDLRILAG